MRFFSNEAKDNLDDQDLRADTVPLQRPGSPWDDRPGGNAEAASGASAPVTGPPDDVDRDTASEAADSGAGDDDALEDRPRKHDGAPVDHDVDVPLDDRADDVTEEPAADSDPDEADEADATDEADKADATDKADEEPAERAETGRHRDDELTPVAEPVVAVAAVQPPAVTEAEPGVVTAGGPAAFFPEAESQPLRDRWREVQLRFVDDPKTSTAEAAALVDETIEKLTASLRQHRGSLAVGGDDTEALRVELRAYRDILDRLLGL
ncbi:hypothetical protein [Actinoplanes regularis]|uniref:Uncharacterized protein n=1 Tax=Actinoplanes regularis TaxID=52697 RepID=A0A239BG71_9ACTN|nr:hypothetical protein [Actinoplanes regularis]GIE87956.1 hypothetical protein Are01nite_44360 [Actinoplanes regularis]SNS06348.1 hypothetical protein SAMN06264365_109160 [Actinoplanes regularis]